MQTFNIIPIAEEHIIGYMAAVDSVAREHKYLSFLEAPPIAKFRAFVLNNIKEDWPHFIALVDGVIVGWCDISSLHRPALSHSGSLGIGVVNRYRGMGIGKALMQAALQKAKDDGLTRIELTVRQNNIRAIALYTKLGFVTEGLHINAVRIDGKYENQFSMGLIW